MAVASSQSWKGGRSRMEFDDAISKPRSRVSEGVEMQELQEEIDNIRRSLADLDAVSLLRKLQERSNDEHGFDESELTEKHGFLTNLSYEDDALQTELMSSVEDANKSTIHEIESLIQTIAKDAEAMETLLSSTENRLGNCESNIESSKRQVGMKHLTGDIPLNQSRTALERIMLKDAIEDYHFEELSLADQIELKRRELKDLENLAKLKDSYLQDNLIFEALKGVTVLGISSGHISLQLKTGLTNLNAKKAPEFILHELTILFDPTTLSIREAELEPNDVDMAEIVSAVHGNGDFFQKVAFVVKQVQNRIRWRKQSNNTRRNRR